MSGSSLGPREGLGGGGGGGGGALGEVEGVHAFGELVDGDKDPDLVLGFDGDSDQLPDQGDDGGGGDLEDEVRDEEHGSAGGLGSFWPCCSVLFRDARLLEATEADVKEVKTERWVGCSVADCRVVAVSDVCLCGLCGIALEFRVLNGLGL